MNSPRHFNCSELLHSLHHPQGNAFPQRTPSLSFSDALRFPTARTAGGSCRRAAAAQRGPVASPRPPSLRCASRIPGTTSNQTCFNSAAFRSNKPMMSVSHALAVPGHENPRRTPLPRPTPTATTPAMATTTNAGSNADRGKGSLRQPRARSRRHDGDGEEPKTQRNFWGAPTPRLTAKSNLSSVVGSRYHGRDAEAIGGRGGRCGAEP